MNGNPPVPASPSGRSDAPTVIGAGCAQILLPGKGERPTIAYHAEHPGMSDEDRMVGASCCATRRAYHKSSEEWRYEDEKAIVLDRSRRRYCRAACRCSGPAECTAEARPSNPDW